MKLFQRFDNNEGMDETRKGIESAEKECKLFILFQIFITNYFDSHRIGNYAFQCGYC